MSMYTLLRNNTTPSEEEVEAAFEGDLTVLTMGWLYEVSYVDVHVYTLVLAISQQVSYGLHRMSLHFPTADILLFL